VSPEADTLVSPQIDHESDSDEDAVSY
jgi:hypothetical protein